MKKAVAGIVIFNGKVLLGKKIIKPGHFVSGGWHIPGGHIKTNESEKNALIREIKEETNLDIIINKKICQHYIKEDDVELSWFLCSTYTNDAHARSDISQIIFVEKNKALDVIDKRASIRYPKKVLDYFLITT